MKKQIFSLQDPRSFVCSMIHTYGDFPGFCALTGSSEDANYIFLEPFETFRVSSHDSTGLDRLKTALQTIEANPNLITGVPLLAGFFAYEFLHRLEEIPKPLTDNYLLDDLLFFAYRTIVKVHNSTAEIYSLDIKAPYWVIDTITENYPPPPCYKPRLFAPEDIDRYTLELCAKYASMSSVEFKDKVLAIKESILNGDVYQVNLSQQISAPTSRSPANLFEHLTSVEEAQFGAFFRASEDQTILSLSPELFFQRKDQTVSVRPIKGTSPRFDDVHLDTKSKHSLFQSEKDHAELAMIVDLMRNDLGKVALPGSVTVGDFPTLFSLTMVHHLCTEISAELPKGISDLDILSALFPSGSITGTPKISAMKQISHLEGTTRGVYCGAIGYFGKYTSAFNVAIRTGVLDRGVLRFQVGGGITIESDPDQEYIETINKARAFTAALIDC